MSPTLYAAVVCTLCMLIGGPDATTAFVGPNAFLGALSTQQRTAVGATRTVATKSSLRMADEPATEEEANEGPTALEISKGIAHPEAVFTVPENILKVLPHRYPFALVDKVLHFEPGKRIVGVKCITNNEPQFTGHFPDLPIMPGVLQVCVIQL